MPGDQGDFSNWEVREVRRSERGKVRGQRNEGENRLSRIALRMPAFAGIQQANIIAKELSKMFQERLVDERVFSSKSMKNLMFALCESKIPPGTPRSQVRQDF
ncbi:hypothetical protein [Methanocella arvoryzae]|uniref:hypothetical protein n=1 Tax=Methanocella arvoryzae TaxID=1175445 RepID=UPI001E3F6E42|nr:hypothetical protein [Methanocella arvoryzae]